MKYINCVVIALIAGGCGSGSNSKRRDKKVFPEKKLEASDLLELSKVEINENYMPEKYGEIDNFPIITVAGFPGISQTWTLKYSSNKNCIRSEGSFTFTPKSSNASESIQVTGVFFKRKSECGEWDQLSTDLHEIGRFKFDHDLFQYQCHDLMSVSRNFVELIRENFQTISGDDNWVKPEIGIILVSTLPLN